mgnify:CR=1 FL=1
MKAKTLYYRAIIREYSTMINTGFIIVTICNEKIISVEGVFTEDYFTAKIDEETISLEYYSKQEGCGNLKKEWEVPIELEYFELPINLEAQILIKEDEREIINEDNECRVIQIATIEKIVECSQQEEYKNILQKFKNNNNVFN